MAIKAAYISEISTFTTQQSSFIVGELVRNHKFETTRAQLAAWDEQIAHLQDVLQESEGLVAFECQVPRLGKRIDVVLLIGGVLYVLEYKTGPSSTSSKSSGLTQVVDYALDLKYFHKGSRDLPVVPVLVASNVRDDQIQKVFSIDRVAEPCCISPSSLLKVINLFRSEGDAYDCSISWKNSSYHPTPTILEAAKHLYAEHSVAEIASSESGSRNLELTNDAIREIITDAKINKKKTICFVTGVPGSGKTLAGLNIVSEFLNKEKSVFLTGNVPLASVLREALAEDAHKRLGSKKEDEKRKASVLIQNVHNWRGDLRDSADPPIEHLVVFDEAQRAWDAKKLSQDQKTRAESFSLDQISEPHLVMQILDRHPEWCVLICLVGNGQEIHSGEAGIGEWVRVVSTHFPTWSVYSPSAELDVVRPTHDIEEKDVGKDIRISKVANFNVMSSLHLDTDIRSFRASSLSSFIDSILRCDAKSAQKYLSLISNFPLCITRDINAARDWLREHQRGTERIGLVGHSNSVRLRAEGIFVMQVKDKADHWWLGKTDDIRSSNKLEQVATEFKVQGLELDWVGVCWDANLRYTQDGQEASWSGFKFHGNHWKAISKPQIMKYLINSYRVLLTRARQGVITFVPKGDPSDKTRHPDFYDPTYKYLVESGFREI